MATRKNIIVVVEDDPEQRELVTEVLGRLKEYTIYSAGNSRDGFQKISQAIRNLALVITDLNIGKDDGGELLARLDRAVPDLRKVPRIIMSGTSEDDYMGRERRRRGRYDLWLNKPAELQVLLETVRRLLN